MPNRPCPRRVAAVSVLGAIAALAFALGGATVDAFFPTNGRTGGDGHALLNTLGPADPAEVNGVLTTGLTSGYYHGEDRVPPTLPSGHKDRHGGPFDSLSSQDFGAGLNRDSNSSAFSPQSALHET